MSGTGRSRDITDELLEEVKWLRSFGWSDERICDRFRIDPKSLYRNELRHAQEKGVSS